MATAVWGGLAIFSMLLLPDAQIPDKYVFTVTFISFWVLIFDVSVMYRMFKGD